jgi:hypothetical protein
VALGFHIVVAGDRPAEQVFKCMDEVAGSLGFSPRESWENGFQQRSYRRSDQHPELCFWFDFRPGHYHAAMTPLVEKEVLVYGLDFLVGFWSGLCLHLDAALGRTYREGLYGTVDPSEIVGPLRFVDWYQFFSPGIVDRWGLKRLREGPFHTVEEYPSGACGIWLSNSPFERIPRSKAAEYLGVVLPKLYGKNPQTGEPMEISWG